MRIRWRGLELPNRVVTEKETLTSTYGKFVIEPFERGFGATIGNSLRRILLSSLEGSAVTRIKIQGVQHEFTTIPGIVEDVTDICLNLKSVVVKNHGPISKTLRIERHERGVVTAGDIVCDDQVEVFNKDLGDCDDDRRCLTAYRIAGRKRTRISSGFRTTEHQNEVGVIPIDSIFSPITRVRYKIEETRVGQRTNYDRLILEIWTNGTVVPEIALVEAAKILRKHLNPIITYREPGPETFPDSGLRNMHESTGYAPVDLELEERLSEQFGRIESIGSSDELSGIGRHQHGT